MSVSLRRYDLLHSRLIRFTRTLRGVERQNVRSIHRSRIALRRLRELVPILNLDGSDADKLIRRMRKARRRLGPMRELDALITSVNDQLRKKGDTPALMATRDHLLLQRQKASADADSRPPLDELHRISRAFEKIAHHLEPEKARDPRRQQWRWSIDARVVRCAHVLRERIHERGSLYSPDGLHLVRIAIKKLRYSVELGSEMSPGSVRPADLAALKRAQTLLGQIHDNEELIERTRRFQAALVQPNLAVWRDLDGLITSLESACHRLHARYLREREGLLDICHRLTGKTAPRSATARRRAG